MAGGTPLAPRGQSMSESEAAETAPARGDAVQMLNTTNSTNPILINSIARAKESYSSQCRPSQMPSATAVPKKSQHGRAPRVFDRRPFTVRSAKAILSLSAVSSQGAIAKRYCVDSRRTGRITPSASPPCALTHPRHARPCAGHPRLASLCHKDVDGRDKPGHDGADVPE